jgi:predicted O-linked N-acetylglucosamine transferase (SPINDLY family)
LKLIGEVDVAVDAFPYNGGITTAETLWQGVPVLSVAGERYASRQGLAILTAIGRAGWCAATAEDLAEVGARVVGDLGLLAKERAGLREVVRGSALVDAVGYGREFGRVILEEINAKC